MGLLDDAIREHLELKKRSGAPADELRRLESEALGDPRATPVSPPVVSDSEDVEDLVVPAETPIEAEAVDPVVADERDWMAEPDEVPASEALEPPPVAPERVLREPRTPEVAPPVDPEPRVARERSAAEVAPPADPPAPRVSREVDTDDIFADDPPPVEEPEEDVLEETPDFLQETPEHDRLWFEQKPPRDFDFGA